MADNVTFQAGLTATPAKDTIVGAVEIRGVKYQRMTGSFDYVLFYYDGSGNIEYKCEHPVHGTATSETDWRITRYVWVSNNLTDKQILSGSVDGRAALGWV